MSGTSAGGGAGVAGSADAGSVGDGSAGAGSRSDEHGMVLAIVQARRAAAADEVPVGAVALRGGEVIARARNRMERGGDATAHAEMVVLRRAAKVVGNWRLTGVTLVVTLEPCPMCAGAMVQSRIERCVYGARDPKKGADGSVYDVLRHSGNNHRIDVVAGVMGDECGALLSDFFRGLRAGRAGR